MIHKEGDLDLDGVSFFFLVCVKVYSHFRVKNMRGSFKEVMVVIIASVLTARISKLSGGSFILFKTETEVTMLPRKLTNFVWRLSSSVEKFILDADSVWPPN